MPDVRMPDGTIIRNVPEGTTKSDLMRRLSPSAQVDAPTGQFDMDLANRRQPFFEATQGEEQQTEFRPQRRPSFGEALGRSAAERFLSNAFGAVDLAASAGGRMLAGQPLVDREVNLPEGADPRMNQPLVNFPKVGERDLPLPTGEQAVAAGEAALGVHGALRRGEPMNIGENFQQARQRQQDVAQARPGATMAGNVAGDVGTLLSGRLPLRSASARATRDAVTIPKAPLPPGLRRQVDDITKKVIATKLPRGMRRAAETGLEGAALAVLDEGDPVMTASFSAGSQAAGSLFLSMTKPMVTSKTGLLSTVALGAVGVQLFKEATPGGQDRILESIETSIFKVLPTVALGTLSAAAGFGRTGDRFQQNLPKLADAITTIPRGSIVSLLKDLSKEAEEGNDTTLRVVEQFAQDPEYFGPGAMARLQRALRSEDKSVAEEVERMMRNPDFREKLDELGQ